MAKALESTSINAASTPIDPRVPYRDGIPITIFIIPHRCMPKGVRHTPAIDTARDRGRRRLLHANRQRDCNLRAGGSEFDRAWRILGVGGALRKSDISFLPLSEHRRSGYMRSTLLRDEGFEITLLRR